MSLIQQVVTGDGEFDTAGVESYLASVGLARGSAAYTTVAIMGPQSSGKSTLLNTLFGTVFEELDAMTGRHQTTRGIWLARSQTISEPISLVMDLEGSDGRERGEDDTSFERQSALFALSNADVLLINMWAKDVGREAGSGKPLLKTILQVNLKLFGSQRLGGARASLPRTVLLFVFRDKTRTPLELLAQAWETDLQRIWEGVTKPAGLEDASLTDLFELKYAALSNYEDRPEEFQADCAALRRRFTPAASPAESLLRPHPEKLPGSALALSLATAWDTIRANRDLDLPAHRVMVATLRCEELAARQLEAFREAEDWLALCSEAAAGRAAEEAEMEADAALPAPSVPSPPLVRDCGARLQALLARLLEEYDEEARYYDPGVSAAKREAMLEAALEEARPLAEGQHHALVDALLGECMEAVSAGLQRAESGLKGVPKFGALLSSALEAAFERFDGLVPALRAPAAEPHWRGLAPGARAALEARARAAAAQLRGSRLGKLFEEVAEALRRQASSAAAALLESPPADLWPRLRAALAAALERSERDLGQATRPLERTGLEAEGHMVALRGAAQGAARVLAREAASTALPRVKEAFAQAFQRDEEGLPRTWGPSADVPGAAAGARRAAARLLAQLAVCRLEPSAARAAEEVVAPAILGLAESRSAEAEQRGSKAGAFDLLAAREWPGVPASEVMLQPEQVRALWRSQAADAALAVQQAQMTQAANRAAQNRRPPMWAIAAMLVLGFDEAMAVLRNPLWLLVLVLLGLFLRTVYVELDVETELSAGLLPGAISLAAKVGPTLRRVVARSVGAGQAFLADTPAKERPRDVQMGERRSKDD